MTMKPTLKFAAFWGNMHFVCFLYCEFYSNDSLKIWPRNYRRLIQMEGYTQTTNLDQVCAKCRNKEAQMLLHVYGDANGKWENRKIGKLGNGDNRSNTCINMQSLLQFVFAHAFGCGSSSVAGCALSAITKTFHSQQQ